MFLSTLGKRLSHSKQNSIDKDVVLSRQFCSIAVTTYRGEVETTATIGLCVPIILCTLLTDTDLLVEQK